MTYTQQNFKVTYELENVRIATTAAGQLQNGTAYSPSVKILCQNLYQTENSKTGFDDIKNQDLVIKISCFSDSQAGMLANKIQEYYLKAKKLVFIGGIMKNDVVTLEQNADYYLDYFTNLLRELNNKTSTSKDK